MDALWPALADPNRRAMLDALRGGPCSVGELTGRLGLSQPMTSKHLRVLRDAGLVVVHKQAQHRIYAVNPPRLAEIERWLAPYRTLWNDSLDALAGHLDSEEEN
ncbi:MAG: metalloregulator ArsR/SmtB family transcription factor [Nocardiopsaceae bacterium]|jgi:DNA-binding transcriptional ArsR family regulator|nr:metalloregulator ArsR/SmtB family transcription factor [Nocardiopsaceae bacterium]